MEVLRLHSMKLPTTCFITLIYQFKPRLWIWDLFVYNPKNGLKFKAPFWVFVITLDKNDRIR